MVAGKSGGSWKVAYADFVTAMMAFFLVMWICAQDQKLKESVAHYFMDPLGGTPVGAATKPGKSGSLFDQSSHGSVPKADGVAVGRGRSSYTKGEEGVATKLVSDWIHHDDTALQHWRTQGRRARDRAERSPETREKGETIEEAAARLLAAQLRDETVRGVPAKTEGLHLELLQAVMAEVNWAEIAEDILNNVD